MNIAVKHQKQSKIMDKDALFEEREMKRQKIYNMEFDASFPYGNVL